MIRDGAVEQVGPPAALYERPATPFIADFLGSSNRLAGRLMASGAEGCTFASLGGLRFPVRLPRKLHSMRRCNWSSDRNASAGQQTNRPK